VAISPSAATSAGELLGPILAGILWQTGGILALFGVRIVIAIVAEVAAIRVFHERPARAPVTPAVPPAQRANRSLDLGATAGG
jgi:MFS family permease